MGTKASLAGSSNQKRLIALLVFFSLVLLALIGRLAYIQIAWGEELQEMALEQRTQELDVYQRRGTIRDRNGDILAQSATAESIAIRPARIHAPADVAALLAPILEIEQIELYNKISDKSRSFVWLKRQVDRHTADRVRDLNIRGIDISEEPRRFYPNGSLAAHILGFTKRFAEPGEGIIGQEGIELYYDEYLRGKSGSVIMETDLRGTELPHSVSSYIPPLDGLDVVLTIDQVIQYFVEREISNVVSRYDPLRVHAIAMNPQTGEILAMANYPKFDPNEPPRDFENFEQMQEYVKNFSVTDNLEPGSTFKIITAAAALDNGVSTLDSRFYCPGFKMVDGQRIKCWRPGGHGSQIFTEVMMVSCNPAFMEMALGLGINEFYRVVRNFGLGEVTGIDVAGEGSGILVPLSTVKNVDLARMGFGQAIALTQIQLINTVAAIINGGNLMRPHLTKALYQSYIDEITGLERTRLVREMRPERIRQTISSDTSKIMAQMLEDTVTYGSGRNAYIPGFRVGGKTGTAQKYGPAGQIMEDKNISSFIGFAPADDPEIIVLFVVDEPIAPITFGSVIAAPFVGRILEDALNYMGVEPVFDEETLEQMQKIQVPDVEGMPLEQAVVVLERAGLRYIAEESGTVVENQMPKPGEQVLLNSIMLLYLENDNQDGGAYKDTQSVIAVPDVLGKSIREANGILISAGLEFIIDGSGVAIEQQPAAGSMVEPETAVTVRFGAPSE